MLSKFKKWLKKNPEKHKPEITSYSYVKIPNDYHLMRIATYNINIRNTTTINSRIAEIITYIFGNYKDLKLDILCLQGINDLTSLYHLIQEIKRHKKIYDIELFFAPNINDDQKDIMKIKNHMNDPDYMFNNIKLSDSGKSGGSNGSKEDKKLIKIQKVGLRYQNIIISRYPILSMVYGELDDEILIDDILGIQTVIGANILVNEHVISLYNTSLSKDIKTANVTNDYARKKEVESLFKIIKKNSNDIDNLCVINDCKKSDVHLLAGSLNINENSDANIQEYKTFIRTNNCIDIFRYKNISNIGYTNINKERLEYILFILSDDIYEGELLSLYQKIRTSTDLFNFIFMRYKFHVIECYKRDDLILSATNTNYPVEAILMLQV